MIATFQMGGEGRLGLAGGVSGELDAFAPNLWAAYGITRQRHSSVYDGPCMRVRKSTGGDTTTEIDIPLLGRVHNAAVLALFAGSETVVPTLFYDQNGNGRHLIQATGANQPRVTNAGTPDGLVRFDGTNDELLTTAVTGTPSVFSVSMKANFRAGTPTQVVYAIGAGSGNSLAQAYIPAGGGVVDIYTANAAGTASDRKATRTFATGNHVFGFMHNLTGGTDALDSRFWFDGNEQTTTNASGNPTGNFTAQTVRLGSGGLAANWAAIDVFSFAIWEANQAANMSAIAAAMA